MRLPRHRANRLLLFAGAPVLLLIIIGALVSDPTPTPSAGRAGASPSWTAQPSPTNPTDPPPTTLAPATSKPKPTNGRKTTPPPKRDPRYPTCKEAKAHGYGPYYRGKDPEYAWYIDADHDGVVCE